MDYRENYEKWLNHPNLCEEQKQELRNMSEQQIKDSFYTDVAFGTAGMRGLMGLGPNRLNIFTIRKATQGFANYLNKNSLHSVAIAYDNRFNSKEFAFDCAALLAANGIETYIFDSLRPTPELSYTVRYFKCDGGIMITASHNPKEYNGYKLYDETGCQLIPELAQKVIDEIANLGDLLDIVPPADYDRSLVHVVNKEVDDAYYADCLSIQLRKDVNKDFKIAFSLFRTQNVLEYFNVPIFIIIISIMTMVLSALNPHIAFIDIVFETVSSLANCGYSLGITAGLTSLSKILLIIIMFIGRVTTVTMTMAIAGKRFKQNNLVNYPVDDVIVG